MIIYVGMIIVLNKIYILYDEWLIKNDKDNLNIIFFLCYNISLFSYIYGILWVGDFNEN